MEYFWYRQFKKNQIAMDIYKIEKTEVRKVDFVKFLWKRKIIDIYSDSRFSDIMMSSGTSMFSDNIMLSDNRILSDPLFYKAIV
jgi:hypothetical protein